MDYPTLLRLLAALEQGSVRYAIFGAVALNLHGLARFTEDLDMLATDVVSGFSRTLFVSPEADNIERLKAHRVGNAIGRHAVAGAE